VGDTIPWDAYTRAVITVELPEGALTVAPTDGPPDGRLPLGLSQPVHVLTAWNPGSEPLDAAVNEERNARMQRELERRRAAWFPARGASPDGRWFEDGFAVTGWTRPDACALARVHDQAAIFELSNARVAVVTADLDRVEDRNCVITLDRAG
jgi:hypothetical protein